MTFDLDTLSFPFLFLPAVLLCFTLAPQRCKNGVLVAASLLFYALGDLRFLPLMLYALLVFLGSLAQNKSLQVALLSVPAAFIQLTGYGTGFIVAAIRRYILKEKEFEAFKDNFYK